MLRKSVLAVSCLLFPFATFAGTAGIDYMSFSYGMSAVYPVGGGFVSWEPDSKTNYTIFKLGVGYAF